MNIRTSLNNYKKKYRKSSSDSSQSSTQSHMSSLSQSSLYSNESVQSFILDGIEEDEDFYKHMNINKPLKIALGIYDSKQDLHDDNNDSKWEPPKIYGLDNSEQIIDPYYLKNKGITDKLDYTKVLKDKIRNLRPLNEKSLDYIQNLPQDKMFELIVEFNKMHSVINDILKGT